jgi:hypothetical protein
MTLIWFKISIYIINKNNHTLFYKLENIINANLFVSGASICFSYIINNSQSQYFISPESHEILIKNLISQY